MTPYERLQKASVKQLCRWRDTVMSMVVDPRVVKSFRLHGFQNSVISTVEFEYSPLKIFHDKPYYQTFFTYNFKTWKPYNDRDFEPAYGQSIVIKFEPWDHYKPTEISEFQL